MKFRKLTAFFLAAVTAASLSVSASAGYVKEGTTPLIDIKQSVKGRFGRDDEGYSYLFNEKNEKITGKSLVYLDATRSETDLGFDMRMWCFDKETGHFTGKTYTGFTKDKKGRRYYDKGVRIIGWYKIGNSWYHFNKNGYADTGKVKIAGVSYTFDKKGKWTGKVAKSGVAPKDFKLEISESSLSQGFSTDGVISYGNIYDENYDVEKYTADVKITNRDRQVIYSMLMESGMEALDGIKLVEEYLYEVSFKGDYLKDAEEDIEVYVTDPPDIRTITVVENGKTMSVSVDFDTAKQIMHFDETAYKFHNLTTNLLGYYSTLRTKYPPRDDVEYFYLD